jgi:MFS family permease
MGLAGICIYAIFPAIMHRSGVLAAINVAIMLAACGAILSAVFLKDRMPATRDKKNGLLSVVPALRGSAALRAAYLCSLIMRADITVMATYLLTWGVNAGIARGMDSGAATSLAKWPILIITITSLVCFPCIGILLDKKGRVFTLLLSISLATAAMLLVAAVPDPFSPLCYIAAVLAGFGMSGSIAGANTLAIDAAPPGMSGSIMGGLNTMQPIGIIFFLGLGGYLFDAIGPHTPFVLKGIAGLALGIWLYINRKTVSETALPASA